MVLNKKLTTLASVIGTSVVVSLSASPMANAAGNPFATSDIGSGYQVAEMAEGKCGGSKAKAKKDGQCGEGKCGGSKAKAKKDGQCGEGKCGGSKDKKEGSCGGSKDKKEGSCGGDK